MKPLVPLSKKELAGKYKVSVKTLSRWIHSNNSLYENLVFLGYKKTNKILTIEQLKLILNHLGEPVENGQKRTNF